MVTLRILQLLRSAAEQWVEEHPNESEQLGMLYSTNDNNFLVEAERAFFGALTAAGYAP